MLNHRPSSCPVLGRARKAGRFCRPGLLALLVLLMGITGTRNDLGVGTAEAAEPAADNGAVILLYHRFGEDDFPSTNVRLAQFEAHIQELTSGAYHVLPLPEIIAALAEGRPLPARTVGISIDDAFRSVYTEAWPRLRAAGLPFTLFAATDMLDGRRPGYMKWSELREMSADSNVTLGHHGHGHGHMPESSDTANRADIATATASFEKNLGFTPTLFAYPYGEYGLAQRTLAVAAGFAAAFGQQSGAIARSSDRFALPRFPFNEAYSDLDRFRLVVNSLPLPAVDITPADPLVTGDRNPPSYGFSIVEGFGSSAGLNCFASKNDVTLEMLGDQRVEIRLARPFPPGRNRINCTQLGPDKRWRWHGAQFYVPRS